MLKQLKIQDWSYQKREQREKIHKELSKIAYPENQKTITLEEFMKQSGGGLGG